MLPLTDDAPRCPIRSILHRSLSLAIGCVIVWAGGSAAEAPDAVRELRDGQIVLGDFAGPPPDDAAWQPVSLPDAWSQSRPGASGEAWYRFEVDRAQHDERLGLYIPKVAQNVAVFIEGERIGACGKFEKPVANCWNRPLYFPISSRQLDGEVNVIHVRFWGDVPYQYLAAPQLGPDRILAPRHAHQLFVQVTITELSAIGGAVLTLVLFSFWIGSRDPVYGFGALQMFLWGIGSLSQFVIDLPMSTDAWKWVTNNAYLWMCVPVVLLVHRLFGLERPWVDRAVFGFACACSAATALIFDAAFARLMPALLALSQFPSLYAWLQVFLAKGGDLSRVERVCFVSVAALPLAFGGHDLAIQFGWLPFDSPVLLHFSFPGMLFTLGLLFTSRFIRTFNQARRYAVELEERVREKHAELETNFVRIRELEDARVLLEERERIMREIHDGMGGQLVSTLALVEGRVASPEEISHALRTALDDMRLLIDSLDPDVHELPTLLGMIRERVEPSVGRQGVKFDWRVTDVASPEHFGPTEYLQIMRIVQEAITNVLKHARASVITVSTQMSENAHGALGVRVTIRDDGVGFEGASSEPVDQSTGPGRGLVNMRRRAEGIGGTLRILRADPGTAVDLWIPQERQRSTSVAAR